MSDIEKRYYTIPEIAETAGVYASKIDYWMRATELSGIVGVPWQTGNGRKYDTHQRYLILRMCKIMESGNYTPKGAIEKLKEEIS